MIDRAPAFLKGQFDEYTVWIQQNIYSIWILTCLTAMKIGSEFWVEDRYAPDVHYFKIGEST